MRWFQDFSDSIECGRVYKGGPQDGPLRLNRLRSCDQIMICSAKSLMVGKSKTAAGTGRIIPLNPRAVAVLTHWRGLFAAAEAEH